MTKEELWNRILEEMVVRKLAKDLFVKSFLRPLKILHIANGIILLKVADQFNYDYIYSNFKDKICEAAHAIDSTIEEVRLTTEESAPVPKKQKPIVADDETIEPVKKVIPAEPEPELSPFQHPLNSDFTFDGFIAGHDNNFVLKSAVTVSNDPLHEDSRRFSPLYIYGEVGSGKSHLLHAVGNRIRKERPKLKVVLTTTEEFFYNYSAALGKKPKDGGKEYERFFKTFAECDVLLMDEIQHISGKTQCQIELFRIFNTLHQKGSLMVFTSDRSPEKLLGTEERLISRLQWGLAVEIQEPQIETRMAILTEMARKKKLDLPLDVISFIAEKGPANIRELEGIIIKILATASLDKSLISVKMAENALNQRLLSDDQKFSVERIISFCCDHFSVDRKMLLGKGRSQEVALCRMVGMYIARKHTSFSLKAVGMEFGGRDHSTVVHAEKTITDRISKDTEFSEDIEMIIRKLSK